MLLSTLDGSAIGQDSNLVLRPDEGVIIAPANSSHRRGQCLILLGRGEQGEEGQRHDAVSPWHAHEQHGRKPAQAAGF